jgi:hypothetical protein
MLTFTTRTYKNGALSQQVPTYQTDCFRESLAAVEGLRSFAARAGVRNAAKSAATKGWPLELTRTVLLCESVWRAANTFHEAKLKQPWRL